MVVQEAKAAKTAEMAVAVVNQEGVVDVKEEAADQEEAEVAQAALTLPAQTKKPTNTCDTKTNLVADLGDSE